MSEKKDVLIKKITDYSAKVAVLGMGYVGLPFATVFADAGFTVIGIDPDESKIELVKQGIDQDHLFSSAGLVHRC